MTTRWRLHPFGIARLEAADAAVPLIELARKDAAALFYVAREGTVASARVAQLLWPTADDKGALNNLRQRLYRLRKSSGARLLEMADTVSLANDLQLEPDDAPVRLEADPSADIAQLLAGHDFDAEPEFAAWLAGQRRVRDEAVADVLAGIAARHEREGGVALALRYAQRLVALTPLSEHAHRRVMRLHYLRGDTAAAAAAFEACERTLKDELGARPSAETIELLKTIEDAAAPTPRVPAPLPAALIRPPRTIGRAAAAAQLERAHADGQRVFVVGEAGIGKTRLLQDFARGRDDAVYVQARPSDAGVPFSALARVVRSLLGTVPVPLNDSERSRLAPLLPDSAVGGIALSPTPGLEALLARAHAGGLHTLVIDDLHFGDRASIETLRLLVDSPALDSLRWVFAHRPVESVELDAALLDPLADAHDATVIRLEPLAAGDVETLLASAGIDAARARELAPALWRHSGGNPLFLLETMRALAATENLAPTPFAAPQGDSHVLGRPGNGRAMLPRPESIALLIERRLRKLSAPALALARVAAIAVPDFSIALAEQALGVKAMAFADAWRELEAAGVLNGEAFAHDLVHDAVLRLTPDAIARHAHGEVAAFLHARGGEPASIARHWLAAGAGVQAGDAYRAAAARAAAAGRLFEQHELLALAAQGYAMGGDPTRSTKAAVDAAEPLIQSRGPNAALEWIDGITSEHDGVNTALLHAARATALLFAQRPADAEQAARLALEAAPAGDDALRLSAARLQAQALAQQAKPIEALALFRTWRSAADRIADTVVRTSFYGDYVTALMLADLPLEALPAADEHLRLAQSCGQTEAQVGALMNLFSLHVRRGDAARALDHAEHADRLLDGPAQARLLWGWNRIHLGIAHCGAGRFGEGLADYAAAREALLEANNATLLGLCDNRCAEAYILLGQTAKAAALLKPGGEMRAATRAAQLLVRARLERALGRDAVPLLREASTIAAAASTVHDRLRLAIELLDLEEDTDAAVSASRELQQRAHELQYLPLALSAARWRLDQLIDAGNEAERCSLAAMVEAETRRLAGPSVYLPEGLLSCARAYRLLGRGGDEARCLVDAWRWIHTVALPHVPAAMHNGFLDRQPINRAVRAAVARGQLSVDAAPGQFRSG